MKLSPTKYNYSGAGFAVIKYLVNSALLLPFIFGGFLETALGNTSGNKSPSVASETNSNLSTKEFLVQEVVVEGINGELEQAIYRVIKTQPGQNTSQKQIQADVNAIFATGYFREVDATQTNTPLGLRVTFLVEKNPVLRQVNLEGSQVLPQKLIDTAFANQYGKILNLRELATGLEQINKWYADNGYVLANIISNPQVSPDGKVTLTVAEGTVEAIAIRFMNSEGETTDSEGNPIPGKTKPHIIQREMELKPGVVFNKNTAQADLQRIAGLRLFEDLNLNLQPGTDPRQVVVVVNVTEGNTFSISPAGGFSSASGLFLGSDIRLQNIGGRNQSLNANVEYNQRGLLFDTSFTDPWIGSNTPQESLRERNRISLTVNAFRRRTLSRNFDGGDTDIELANGDRPRVNRTGASISLTRSLGADPLKKSTWIASAGLQYQHVSLRDGDGDITPTDELGNQLSFNDDGTDNILSIPLSITRDTSNNRLQPTSGSRLRLSSEQSIPIGDSSLFYNKLSGSYSFYIPTRITKFTPECRQTQANKGKCPQTFAFNIKGGTTIGDLAPYAAFSLGGVNSVRGYEEGDLGTSRSFIQASAEYRFPLLSFINGALFFDAATDLGTTDSVPGNPGGARNKPGSGYGYGAGVRIQSPLGPIRLDYGRNDEGESRIQFGIGERF